MAADRDLDEVSRLLRDLSSDLREERFIELRESSEGILQDTWYEGEGHDVLRHWPGGTFENGFTDLFSGEEQILEEFCETEGFETLGVGSGRVVVKPEDYDIAFKVARYGISARFGSGREANQIEANRWQSIGEEPLLPIYAEANDYSWLACPVAEPLESYDRKVDTDAVKEGIKSKLEPYSGELCLRDIGEDNIGYRDGDWYWLDYGQPKLENARLYGLVTELDKFTSEKGVT